jgi:predicted nucleic acid-binding protein
MTSSPLLLDTCVVLSLYASQHMAEILRENDGPFRIADAVLREALYVHVIVDGVREKQPVALEALIADGTIGVIEPETEAELQSLIDYSLILDEGEAMTCALALHRGYRIATDEKKTIRIVGNSAPIIGALDLVRSWVERAKVQEIVVQKVLAAIEDRGYIPGATHAHYSWWTVMRHK